MLRIGAWNRRIGRVIKTTRKTGGLRKPLKGLVRPLPLKGF